MSKYKKVTYTVNIFSIALLLLVILVSPFNHRELFNIYNTTLLPARVLSAILVFLTPFYVSKKVIKDKLFVLLLCFSFTVSISSIFSQNPIESLFYSIFFWLPTSMYAIFRYLQDKFNNLYDYFVYTFLFSSLVTVVFFVYQVFCYYQLGILVGSVWPVTDRIPRFGSVFWDINHYGFFLVMTFWMSIFAYMRYKKNFYILYAGVVFIPLFFTSSRSAFLGLVFSSLYFFIFKFYRQTYIKRNLNILFFVFGLFPFYIYFFSQVLGTLVRDIFFYRIHSFFTHFILLGIGIDIFKDNFLFGVGVSNFDTSLRGSSFFEKFALLDPGALSYKVPLHSVWVQILSESGIIAFLIFLFLFVFLIAVNVNKFLKTKNAVFLILSSMLVSMGVSGVFYSYNLEFYWVLFIFAATFSLKDVQEVNIQISKFVRYMFGRYLLISYLIAASFILFVLVKIDLPPTLSETTVFNSSKNSVGVFFYSSILSRFQYMLGFYPFAGRLLSLVFFMGSVLVILLNVKKISTSLFLLFLTSVIYSLFNGFNISPLALYLYLVSVILSILFYALNLNVEVKKNSYLFFLMVVVTIFSFYLSFSTLFYKPFYPELSNLTKDVARKFSISDFYIYTDSSVNQQSHRAIEFYLEPSVKVSNININSNFDQKSIVFTTIQNPVSLPYTHQIINGSYKAYIQYVKGY